MVPEKQIHTLSSLGKYQLIAALGQGGMAKVYLALVAGPGGFNKLLVVKVLSEEMIANAEDSVQQFWDEARLSARLLHPNIVHTYEVGEFQGRHFIAMEYLDGQTYRTLQMRTRSAGRLHLEQELRIIAEVARGLHYAHELAGFQGESLGIVHRDISPQNVFLTYDGQVKLIDFGIAKTHDAAHETRVGIIKGKLDYIAPEQLRGETLDGRADIFSLGVMLWEAVGGKRFSGGPKVTDVTKVHVRLQGGEAKIRDVKPDAPEALVNIIERAIAIDPAARYRDAGSLADDLEAYLESTGSRPTAKNLAGSLKTIFEEDRRTMHKLIEEKVQAFSSGTLELANTGDIPVLREPEPQTGSGVWRGDSGQHGGSGMNKLPRPSTTTGSQGPGAALRRMRVPAALALGAIVFGGGYLLMRSSSEKPVANAASAAAAMQPSSEQLKSDQAVAIAPTAEKPAAIVEPGTANSILLEIKVTPASAQLSVDGAQVPAPFSASFRKDGVLHQIEATAKGYRPFKKLVGFDQDRSFDILLEQAPVTAPVRRAVVAHPTNSEKHTQAPERSERNEEVRSAPAEEPAPRAITPGSDIGVVKTRPNRGQIDVADPYATGK